MSRFRRILLFALCALLAVLAAWWLLYVPYEPTLPFKAMPANAVLVSAHDRLAGRLDGLLASPPVDAALSHAGLDRKWLEKIENDPDVKTWLPRLAGRRLVLAYVPSLGNTGNEALLLAGWAGGYSQCLRWLASLNLVPNLVKAGSFAKRPVWRVKLPRKYAGRVYVSVSMAEGMVLACVSRDPLGVRHMLDTLDGMGPVPALTRRGLAPGVSELIDGVAPDRVWTAMAPPAWFELTTQSRGETAGTAWLRHRVKSGAPLPVPAEMKDAAMLLGDIPEAVCLFEPSSAQQLLLDLSADRQNVGGKPAPAWMKIAAEVIEKSKGLDAGRPLGFACLLGGEYRTRLRSLLPADYTGPLKGLPVPVLMAGIRIADPVDAQALAGRVVDSLNAKYRLGIIPWPLAAGAYEVFALEGTGDDDYSKLAVGERCAFAVCGGWLIFSSGTDALLKIVARFQRDEAKLETGAVRWLKAYEAAGQDRSVAFLWSDLDEAGVTVKDGLGLWKMALDETRPSEARTIRSLREGMAWADTVRMLRHCSVAAAPAGNSTELRFRFGDEPKQGR